MRTHSHRTSTLVFTTASFALVPAAALRAQVTVDWVQPTRGVAVAVDSAGNVCTVDFEQALGAEMTITKRSAKGDLLWQVSHDQTDPTKWEKATWLVTDGDDHVVVTGTLMSGYSNPVNAASIVMRFDPDGTLLWRHVYESDFDGSRTHRCLVDAANNVYVLGMGSGPSGYVLKVKKFAPDGTPIWTWFDEAGIGAPVNFKLTPDDHIVITARAIIGSINGYAKITLDGLPVWSLAGVSSLPIGDIAGDAAGNAYIVHGEYVMNGGTVIRKVDPAGALLWQITYPFSGFRVEVDGEECPVVCGFPTSGTPGAAFIKLAPTGAVVWANMDADGPLGLLLHARLVLDSHGNAYLAAGILTEMAVCRVNRDGTSAWTQTLPFGSGAQSIALGPDERSLAVVGGTTARLSFPGDACPCPGDFDANGAIDFHDLLVVIAAWGTPAGDLTRDGATDIADLLALLAAWGPCC